MKLILLITLFLSFTTQANTFDQEFNKGMKKGVCKDLNLSKEQKATLKQKMIAMKHAMIDFQAAMKHARLSFRIALMADDATIEGLGENIDAITDAKEDMIKAKLTLMADIALNVFTPKQKRPGLRCMRKMMKRHRRGMKSEVLSALKYRASYDARDSCFRESA